MPFILGHNGAEMTYQKSIPYVVKALQCFAQQQPDNFVKAFEILEYMADFTPKLLTPHLSILIEFSLRAAHNAEFENQVRVRVVQFIGNFCHSAFYVDVLTDAMNTFRLVGQAEEEGHSEKQTVGTHHRSRIYANGNT